MLELNCSKNKINFITTHYHHQRLIATIKGLDALLQHIKRAAYVAGWIWGNAQQPSTTLPSRLDWGWIWMDR